MTGAAAVAQKGGEWWRCFENQCKQTMKKSMSDKGVGAEFLLSLVFENRFFSHMFFIQNKISINSPLNYVI